MVPELETIKQNQGLVKELLVYLKEKLGYAHDPQIVFLVNKENAANPLGKTAFYSPDEQKVSVYVSGRHFKDVARSLAHELCHHAQNHSGMFENVETMEGYAQADEHLRKMEADAYLRGNMLFRDFEDQKKGQKGIEPEGDK